MQLTGRLEDGTSATIARALGVNKPSLTDRFLQGGPGICEIFIFETTPYGSVSRSLERAQFVDQEIRPLELSHGMSTRDFMGRYRRGQLGDDKTGELFRWNGKCDLMERAVRNDIITQT